MNTNNRIREEWKKIKGRKFTDIDGTKYLAEKDVYELLKSQKESLVEKGEVIIKENEESCTKTGEGHFDCASNGKCDHNRGLEKFLSLIKEEYETPN